MTSTVRLSWFVGGVVLLLASSVGMAATDFKPVNYKSVFEGVDGCFLLVDLRTGREVARHNNKRCDERVWACSTFKVPLSLIAFDRGVLNSTAQPFKWDGKNKGLEEWNADQTTTSWMHKSVVWVSQELTPKIGKPELKRYLKAFEYGNQDISGGLTKAWLASSLKLSAREQARFWRRFWTGGLPVSEHATSKTKEVLPLWRSERGAEVHGKTGSGHQGGMRVGWFAGHLGAFNGREYVFAVTFTDRRKPLSKEFAGPEARAMALQILSELGLY